MIAGIDRPEGAEALDRARDLRPTDVVGVVEELTLEVRFVDAVVVHGDVDAIAGGLAHFAGLPRIELNGDEAVATSYLQILTPHPTAEPHEVPNHGVSKGYRIHRVGVNRWELVRTRDGWKIKKRSMRSLDGTEPAREILRSALKAFAPR